MSLVYHKKKYVIFSLVISVGLFLSLSVFSQFIFTTPYFVFYVPSYAILDLSLIVIISVLSGLVASSSIYRFKNSNISLKKSGASFFGPVLGASAGACGCSSFGLSAVSVMGTVGGTATSFLNNYEIPLRLASIVILSLTYYTTIKGISNQCKIIK